MSRRASTEKKVNYADSSDDEEVYVDPKSKKRQSSAMSAPGSSSSSSSSTKSSTKAPPPKRMKKEPESDSDNSSDEDSKPKSKKATAKSKPESKAADKKKKPASKTKGGAAKSSAKAKPQVKKESASAPVKALSSLERLEEARRAYKWWEAEELPNGLMWRKLEHPGVLFAPPYVRHGVPLLYDGQEVELTDEQEEICSFYAAMPDDGPQLGNPKTRAVFQNNFMADFKDVLVPGHVVKRFDKCDFSRIASHLDKQRSLKKAASLEEKAQGKAIKDDLVLHYGYALIDGRMEKVGATAVAVFS